MNTAIALWLVGGGIVAMVMMLFVVILSRGIEQRRTQPSREPVRTAHGKILNVPAAASTALLTAINPGLGAIAYAAAARRRGLDNIPPRKRVAAGVGIAISLAAVGIFTAIMKN